MVDKINEAKLGSMSVTQIGISSWPTARGSQTEFTRHHGKANSDRFKKALRTGDPLADALVEFEGKQRMRAGKQLQQGLEFGLASLEQPDTTVASLLRSTEPLCTREEQALISTGPRAWCAVPFRLHLLSMSAGALIGIYSSPSIASVLSATGRLQNDTDTRLRMTARWLSSTMLPGSLAPGKAGYIATVQLRLMHARARRAARRNGHDEARFGTPINQIDLAHTWLAFTLGSMRAEASLGFAPSDTSVSETYAYWQRLARLLGIDDKLVGNIRSHADAEGLEAMIGTTSGTPERASVTLTEQTLRAVANALDEISALPGSVSRKVLETLVRRIHGDNRADVLEVGSTPGLGALMAPVTALARVHRAAQRDPIKHWSFARAGRYGDALTVALSARENQPGYATPLIELASASARLLIDGPETRIPANDDLTIVPRATTGTDLPTRFGRAA